MAEAADQRVRDEARRLRVKVVKARAYREDNPMHGWWTVCDPITNEKLAGGKRQIVELWLKRFGEGVVRARDDGADPTDEAAFRRAALAHMPPETDESVN